jgi:hypothetical protein
LLNSIVNPPALAAAGGGGVGSAEDVSAGAGGGVAGLWNMAVNSLGCGWTLSTAGPVSANSLLNSSVMLPGAAAVAGVFGTEAAGGVGGKMGAERGLVASSGLEITGFANPGFAAGTGASSNSLLNCSVISLG